MAGLLEEALKGGGDEIYIRGDWQRMTGKLEGWKGGGHKILEIELSGGVDTPNRKKLTLAEDVYVYPKRQEAGK